MDRVQKKEIVSEIHKDFSNAKIAVLTDFNGLAVEDITELRCKLREEKVEYKVVKNTLARIAVKGTGSEKLADEFTGPVGVAFGFDDPSAPPRVLVEFAKKNKKLVLKVASFAGEKLDLDKIKSLAELPTKDQILGQIAGLLASPMRNMAFCLAGVPRNFVNCLMALKEQKENESK
jgi:large subunit ribosomal protein L10